MTDRLGLDLLLLAKKEFEQTEVKEPCILACSKKTMLKAGFTLEQIDEAALSGCIEITE